MGNRDFSPALSMFKTMNITINPQPMAEHAHHQNSIHGKPHKKKPAIPFKYPKPIFTDRFRLNMEFGKRE